ncbi:MAG: hypothetical protein AAB776_00300 [Patescibacteria group bacterium]
MRIRKDLPKFTHKPSLLVVTGRVSAILYFAHEGVLKVVERIEEKPEYFTDNEGFFESRTSRMGQGRALTAASGSVREPYDDKRVGRFVRRLRVELWRQIHKATIADIYIFTPKGHEILSHLQTRVQNKVRRVIKGDFMHEHPFHLLERLQASLSERTVQPAPPMAARKLLRKTRIAREAGVKAQRHK